MPKVSEVLASSSLDRLDAELFLGEILNFTPTELFAQPDFAIPEAALARFHTFEKSRLAGKSVAVILGHKEFFGLDFFVNENVLIPRPETELLVEEILKIAPRSLLDVGTGSGCVAISAKKNLPNCRIVASDVSPVALAVAQKNSQNLGVEIELIESNLLEKILLISSLREGEENGFEVIAANLPYIPDDSREIQKSVADFEPHLALYGGADGLDLIRKLLTQISKLTQKPKFVLLEFGGGAQTEILEKFAQEIFSDSEITISPDLAGIARVLKISRIVKTLKSNKEL